MLRYPWIGFAVALLAVVGRLGREVVHPGQAVPFQLGQEAQANLRQRQRSIALPGAPLDRRDHARAAGHWINSTVIATPMSRYPEYQKTRTSFGIDVLGTLLVEVEADDGTVGFSVTTGGAPAAFLVEKHFRRFVVGQRACDVERMFDQMFRGSMYYGRKGLTLNAISGVDCAVWDLLGRLRQEPVWAMIGGKVRERQPMYATGPRPDLAKGMGFVGGKYPLPYGPAHGPDGLRKNVELATRLADIVQQLNELDRTPR